MSKFKIILLALPEIVCCSIVGAFRYGKEAASNIKNKWKKSNEKLS